jgi:hypothetical protein
MESTNRFSGRSGSAQNPMERRFVFELLDQILKLSLPTIEIDWARLMVR